MLIAEGEKEAAILQGAEAEKESAILRADAVREAKIREADGEATAIRTVQQAYADSLQMLNEAAPTEKVLTLKRLRGAGEGGRRQVHQAHHPQQYADAGRAGRFGQGVCLGRRRSGRKPIIAKKLPAGELFFLDIFPKMGYNR